MQKVDFSSADTRPGSHRLQNDVSPKYGDSVDIDSESAGFLDILSLLVRRRHIFIICIVVGTLIAGVYAHSRSEYYIAEAQLLIETRNNVAEFSSTVSETGPDSTAIETELNDYRLMSVGSM